MNSITFFYFAPSDVLIPRVDRQCIMRFCEAVAREGIDLELVSLNVRLQHEEPINLQQPWRTYGVEPLFTVRILPSLLTQEGMDTKVGRWNGSLHRLFWYSCYAWFRSCFKAQGTRSRYFLYYFKNFGLALPFLVLRLLSRGKVVLIFEAHMPPMNRWQDWVLKQADGIIANTYRLANTLTQSSGLDPKGVIGLHQGVNLSYINRIRLSRLDARAKLNLPADKPIVCYTGKVYKGYEEVEYLLEAAKLLPDVLMVIVGGRPDQVYWYRQRIKQEGLENVVFREFVPPSEVYYFHFAADALVLYYPRDIPLNDYRSPGKLFEYMASQTPIVAADYPILHEILVHEQNALLAEPANPEALAQALRRTLSNPELADGLAEKAYLDVQEYTWEKRAQKSLSFIDRLVERE